MATETETVTFSLPAGVPTATSPANTAPSNFFSYLPEYSAASNLGALGANAMRPQPGVENATRDVNRDSTLSDMPSAWDPTISQPQWTAAAATQKPGFQPRHECLDESSTTGRTLEESCKRSLEHFPRASVAFPAPTLEFDFRLAVTIKPEASRINCRPPPAPISSSPPFASSSPPHTSASPDSPHSSHPPTGSAPSPQKEIATIASGRWSGSFGNGRVVAGGYDLGQARGFRPIRIVEGAFVLQTTDEVPATLEMRTRGSLSGPCDVLDNLLALQQPKNVDPRRYCFRMFSTIKTTDKRYAEVVNCGLWIASGVWRDDELIIDAYRVA